MATTIPRCVCKWLGARSGVLLLLLAFFALPSALAAQSFRTEELVKQAAELEKQRDWLEACRLYLEILGRDGHRDDARIRQAYQRCLRRYHIVHRHQDRIYRQALENLEPAQALEMYTHVLETITRVYADHQKTTPTALFRHGLEELIFALEETIFAERYFPDLSRSTLETFKSKLEEWRQRKIPNRFEARDQVRAIGRTAQQMGFGSRPILLTVITLEFLSGACNALDEYTYFLTPGYYREVQAALRGRLISIGVEVAVMGEHLTIVRVYPRSPAEEAGLREGHRLASIAGRATRRMTAAEADRLLRGKTGTKVKLEIVSTDPDHPTALELTRRPVVVPSVRAEMLQDPLEMIIGDEMPMMVRFGVGKITISYFQESTLQELKDALAALQADGMKVLILDLRGNPGGLFKSAVQAAELFLPEGLIVVSQTHMPFKERRMSGPIRAENMNALLMPMVVLVDGETASAAEVLAGALKENGRAKLIGQTTFGKGSIQCVLELGKPHFERMPGAIRITVAKLLSPSWQPYSGKGIQPNVPSPATHEIDLLIEARQILLQELRKTLEAMSMTN